MLDLKSRRVQIVGSTPTPDAAFMTQAARRPTDAVDGLLAGHRVLICDRDGKWTDAFRGLLEGVGVRIALTPVQAPNANAYAERGSPAARPRHPCPRVIRQFCVAAGKSPVLDSVITYNHDDVPERPFALRHALR